MITYLPGGVGPAVEHFQDASVVPVPAVIAGRAVRRTLDTTIAVTFTVIVTATVTVTVASGAAGGELNLITQEDVEATCVPIHIHSFKV